MTDHEDHEAKAKRIAERARNQNEGVLIELIAAALAEASHCKDCCCAQSWAALGVTEYTGKGIPEHIAALRAEIAEMHERSDSRDDAIEGEGFVRGLERAKEIAESLVWQAVDAIAAEIAKAGKPLESELPKPSEIRGLWKKVMIAALIFMYFMDSPTYHWITVTEVSAGTWTDGVDTWQGLPGCKSAGMPIGDECKGLTPQVPSEFSVS